MLRRLKIAFCKRAGHWARPFRKPTHSFTTCRVCNSGISRCADCKKWTAGSCRNRCDTCYGAYLGSPQYHMDNEAKWDEMAEDPYERYADHPCWTSSPEAIHA